MLKLPRRTFLHLAAGAAALPIMPRIARAQTYPTKPVRIVVGFAAGGAPDTIGRLMAQWLLERLGQQCRPLDSNRRTMIGSGHKRRFRDVCGTSALPSRSAVKADIPDRQLRARSRLCRA